MSRLDDAGKSSSSKKNRREEDGIGPKGLHGEVTEVDEGAPKFDAEEEDHFGETIVVQDAKELVTHVLHVDDDPTLNPWTFRAFFLGKCVARSNETHA